MAGCEHHPTSGVIRPGRWFRPNQHRAVKRKATAVIAIALLAGARVADGSEAPRSPEATNADLRHVVVDRSSRC